jgi:hypothetical protein
MAENDMAESDIEFVSPVVERIIEAGDYTGLVIHGDTPPAARKLLGGIEPAQLLTVPVASPPNAAAMLAGLWLRHDGLKECHDIVQDLIGPTGAFWHAIMHRREGDFSNAKYWYARCADHRALRLISSLSLDVVGRDTSDERLLKVVSGEYDPDAFVDFVQAVYRHPDTPGYTAAARLQQVEWKALFQHCAYEAAGMREG